MRPRRASSRCGSAPVAAPARQVLPCRMARTPAWFGARPALHIGPRARAEQRALFDRRMVATERGGTSMHEPEGRQAAGLPPEQGATSEAHVPAEQAPTGQEARLPPAHVDPGGSTDHQGQAPAGPSEAQRLIGPIGDRRTFESLQRRGVRASAGPLTVVLLPEPGSTTLRVAYAVGRKVGGAVVRNRVRRRLRAALTDLGRVPGALPSGACLVIVRPAASEVGYQELRESLATAIGRADKRMSG